MKIYDVIKFDGIQGEWLLYKFSIDNLFNHSKLIVSPGQTAIVVHNGTIERVFENGSYEINTELLPVFGRIQRSFYGGNNPFPVEIYFINKTIKLNFYWGTTDHIDVIDPKFGIKLRVRARGQFSCRIEDYEKFFVTISGTIENSSHITFDRMKEFFQTIINQKIRKIITKYFVSMKIPYFEIGLYIDEIGAELKEQVLPQFKSFGFEIINLAVEGIDAPEEDTSRLNDAFNVRAQIEQLGEHDYRVSRGYDVLDSAAKNSGTASAIVGVGFGSQIGQQAGGIIPGEKTSTEFCPKCGAKIDADCNFCPKCGHKLR